MASFSILTRFGSLETLLYLQRGLSLISGAHIVTPKKRTSQRSRLGIYLERGSVHPRVHFSLLGSR